MNCLDWLRKNSTSSEDIRVFYILGDNPLEKSLIEKFWYQTLKQRFPGIKKTDTESESPNQISQVDWFLQLLKQRTLIQKPALYLMSLDRLNPADKKKVLTATLTPAQNSLYFLVQTTAHPGTQVPEHQIIEIGNKTAHELPALIHWIIASEGIVLPDFVTGRLIRTLAEAELNLYSEIAKIKYLVRSNPETIPWNDIYPEPKEDENFFTLVRALIDKDPRIWFLNWDKLKDSDNILQKIRQQLQTLQKIKSSISVELRPKMLLLAQKARDSRNKKAKQEAILEIKATLNKSGDAQMDYILSKENRIPFLIRDQARFEDEELDEILMDLGQIINQSRSKNSRPLLIPTTLLERLFGTDRRFSSRA